MSYYGDWYHYYPQSQQQDGHSTQSEQQAPLPGPLPPQQSNMVSAQQPPQPAFGGLFGQHQSHNGRRPPGEPQKAQASAAGPGVYCYYYPQQPYSGYSPFFGGTQGGGPAKVGGGRREEGPFRHGGCPAPTAYQYPGFQPATYGDPSGAARYAGYAQEQRAAAHQTPAFTQHQQHEKPQQQPQPQQHQHQNQHQHQQRAAVPAAAAYMRQVGGPEALPATAATAASTATTTPVPTTNTSLQSNSPGATKNPFVEPVPSIIPQNSVGAGLGLGGTRVGDGSPASTPATVKKNKAGEGSLLAIATGSHGNTAKAASVADSGSSSSGFESQGPRVTTTMWEDEHTLCYQVEANGVSVVRRADNDMINGTKLLNVAKMTRGRRDGILKAEKVRHVVKIGSMHLKGVWIPFERALALAQREKIVDMLFPLFVRDIQSVIQQTSTTSGPAENGAKLGKLIQATGAPSRNGPPPPYGQQDQQHGAAAAMSVPSQPRRASAVAASSLPQQTPYLVSSYPSSSQPYYGRTGYLPQPISYANYDTGGSALSNYGYSPAGSTSTGTARPPPRSQSPFQALTQVSALAQKQLNSKDQQLLPVGPIAALSSGTPALGQQHFQRREHMQNSLGRSTSDEGHANMLPPPQALIQRDHTVPQGHPHLLSKFTPIATLSSTVAAEHPGSIVYSAKE
ncbi:ABR055Cp [Eremothecium gossypii ATCC 10895]|uniref:ABR055Cp n=1 Tax=Eremothecium gossypii (strain ATCC 10895 / CBS 109.51 / FGSC 9923 / NRRL Y-1056) TaxID=284811 RepID=Q75DH1_EREGS|nr:ABR055Cp [Eremothecium gossypii ATCC 10895]AAS50825.2 ABR055Cp [Eremothecium gossypii ATCC 10895]AEY95114.1 FABR055Cp [Eremothecium gossypii FDAG1]